MRLYPVPSHLHVDIPHMHAGASMASRRAFVCMVFTVIHPLVDELLSLTVFASGIMCRTALPCVRFLQ